MTVTDNSNNKHHLNFLVMNTGHHSLLSLNTCLDLSLTKMNESVHLVSDEPLQNILTQYENVFHGIGCLPGEYDLEIDPSVTPVQVRPRKIALSMKEDVKAKLDVLETQGVIEKVDSPTQWISHLQPVRKSNGTVRLCLAKRCEETASRCQTLTMCCPSWPKPRCSACVMRKMVSCK